MESGMTPWQRQIEERDSRTLQISSFEPYQFYPHYFRFLKLHLNGTIERRWLSIGAEDTDISPRKTQPPQRSPSLPNESFRRQNFRDAGIPPVESNMNMKEVATQPPVSARTSVTRRHFLAASAMATAFTTVPRHVLGAGETPPSEKLNIAGIGEGGMGAANLENLQSQNIVALCDVDHDYAAKTFQEAPNAKIYTDYREMLNKQKDVDAVSIATPDHTHVVVAMAAMRAGKHVYCQKPLAHDIHGVRVGGGVQTIRRRYTDGQSRPFERKYPVSLRVDSGRGDWGNTRGGRRVRSVLLPVRSRIVEFQMESQTNRYAGSTENPELGFLARSSPGTPVSSARASTSLRQGWTRPERKSNTNQVLGLTHGVLQKSEPGHSLWWLTVLCWLSLSSAWAQEREATPAVVNPALRSALRETLSLDGDWDFATDPARVGQQQVWFDPGFVLTNKLTLQVPGCWEAQGVGGPGNSTAVTPEYSIRPLRGSYVGTAWYRKTVTLPASWASKQVWLKIGGVHAQGWFWVNGTYVGHNACYAGAYKYNITDLVAAGQPVVIAVQVRNDVASFKGLMGWIQRFGGLYRSVELDATPSLLIDDVYVAGNLDQQNAGVSVTLRNTGSTAPTTNRLQVTVTTLDGVPAGAANAIVSLSNTNAATTHVILTVSLNPFRAWSPEAPNLYRADVVLTVNGQSVDSWVERFGVRKWEVRGGNFYMNNQKYFIRGFGDDCIYPMTLCSPASRDAHRGHLQLAKAYGFNYVRHHTHCELPEYYEAADEMGIMVQPELPYYGSTPSAGSSNYFQPQADLQELYTHYRRYVSLSTYCMGNEGSLGSPINAQVYQLAKALDPTRLAIEQDGGINTHNTSDFHQTTPWTPGPPDTSWPFDAHEYLNLATEEDPRLAGQYTGAILPPALPENFQAVLTNTPLSWNWGVATLDAGNQLQSVYQKLGLEQARLDPACDGYIYWTMVDVGSPSAQGLLNQFWTPKASTASFFSQFNRPTAILAKFSPVTRIFTSGDSLSVEWWISAFATNSVNGQSLTWSLRQGGSVLASGRIPSIVVAVGDVKNIGTSAITLPMVAAPAKLKLIAGIPAASVTNSWDIWVFPPWIAAAGSGNGMGVSSNVYAVLKDRYPGLTQLSAPAGTGIDLLLVDKLDALAALALEEGKTVILLQLPGMNPGVRLGWWSISPQAGTAIAQHPAFGGFPHDGFVNELFFRLVNKTVSATDPALRQVQPLMVGRGSAGYLLHVFQAASGRGKLLASGLNLLSSYPEAVYLLDQFIH